MSDANAQVLDVFREQFARMNTKLDRVSENLGELKRRMTSREMPVAHLHGDVANQSLRLDRIENRLDLMPA